MKKQITFILIFTLIIIALTLNQTSKKPGEEIPAAEQKQTGVISINEKGLRFTNLEYKFSLSFPPGWIVWDEMYKNGNIQIYNFPEELSFQKDSFGNREGVNKIWTIIADSDQYSEFTQSSGDPDESIETEKININLNAITKTQTKLRSGEKIMSYTLIIPGTNKLLHASITGDEKNFPVLKSVLETLTWKN